MATSARPIVFMDVNIGETPAGRLKMELFSDIVPKYVTLLPPTHLTNRSLQDGGKLSTIVHR